MTDKLDMLLNSYLCKKYIVLSMYSFFCFFCIYPTFSQSQSDHEVKRLQRTIFIYNFAQQLSWSEIDELDTFKIGVLGPDRTTLDLKSMAQKRKIFKKPVEVVRFQDIKNIDDIQLLYVNNKYNYDISYVLNKISGKDILLITENYEYNSSMINMVNIGNSFEYEININRIEDEGFTIAPTLNEYSITSAEKWYKLFQTTENSLEETLDQNREQKEAIENKDNKIEKQERTIISQEEVIGNIEEGIRELYIENKVQEKKYEEKLLIERELEENIQEQLLFIKMQKENIQTSAQEIEKQKAFLDQQNNQIKKQEAILEKQLGEINNQKKINWLLFSIIILVLTGVFFMYRNYLAKKKLNIQLEKKNGEIHEQSLMLTSKNKELEQFAYIASHDLQEPLNTISSFIGLISEDYSDNFDQAGKESLNFIKDASNRMKKLIDSLLEYSRLGRSQDFTDIDMNIVLKELQDDFKDIIDRTGATIHAKKLPIVNGNALELRLLIQNLVSNGIKFIDDNCIPKIHISTTLIEDKNDISSKFWEFSVKDNGIGIPEKHKDRIFAIFQRLHSREKYQGTGIGLAHCKKIVTSHGGKIWLQSEEGKGTTFYFTIPK